MLQKERARVLFMGQCDGEMTVDIELEALDPNPIELDSPKCELGKYVNSIFFYSKILFL